MKGQYFRKVGTLFLVVCLLVTTILATGIAAQAATVQRDTYDLSQMILRRVWFQNVDPIFKIDHYKPVELAEGLNVTGIGTLTSGSQTGFLAPMEEFFLQMGGTYEENDDTVTMELNGDTLVMTVGSTDVSLNGTSQTLPAASVPRRIKVKEQFAPELNPLVNDDFSLIYLPVRYILDAYQSSVFWDNYQSSLYAVVKVMTDQNNMPYLDLQGAELGSILDLELEQEEAIKIADNIVALQNDDGGFMMLSSNVDMAQANFADKLGVKRESSIEGGSTVTELRFLAKLIAEYPDLAATYAPVVQKGLEYLLGAQMSNGGWSFMTGAVGYNSTIAYADNSMVNVLALLNDVAGSAEFAFVRENMVGLAEEAKAAVALGIECILSTQIEVNGVLTGWSSHYNPVTLKAEIGRSYERAGINAAETVGVLSFLMSAVNYQEAPPTLVDSVNAAIAWLDSVKIQDKKMITVPDHTMNNGIERYLVDEPDNITWARNYKVSGSGFVPFFSDRQFSRGDIALMNYDPNDPREVLGTPNNGSRYSSYNVANDTKVMFYDTRTLLEWYIETPDKLISEAYPEWLAAEWPDDGKVRVYFSGDAVATVNEPAEYTLSLANFDKLATVTLWIEVDGEFFAGRTVSGLNGFEVLGDINWESKGGSLWSGRVTIANTSGGVSSKPYTDVLDLTLAVKEMLGTTAVKITRIDLSGYDETNKAVYLPSEIRNGSVNTGILPYFSNYDVNRDGTINQLDLTTAQLYYGAKSGDADWEQAKLADVNTDGNVDIEDLILILNNIVW